MAHTTVIGKTTFIHNGDFSGNITIIEKEGKPKRVDIPFNDLIEFIAEKKRSKMISLLESMGGNSILELQFK